MDRAAQFRIRLRAAADGFEIGDQVRRLGGVQAKVEMAVEMGDHLAERVVAAVAEIGRGHGEVAQGRRVVRLAAADIVALAVDEAGFGNVAGGAASRRVGREGCSEERLAAPRRRRRRVRQSPRLVQQRVVEILEAFLIGDQGVHQ